MNLKQLSNSASFLFAFLALPWLAGCNPCKEEIVERTTSPDGKWTATILTRDCGATTSEYMGVNLQDAKQKNLETKNEVFVTKDVHRLHVSWQENTSLQIDCENCTADDVKKRLEMLGPVQIIYR